MHLFLFLVTDRETETDKQEEKHDTEWIDMQEERKRDGWKDGWIN